MDEFEYDNGPTSFNQRFQKDRDTSLIHFNQGLKARIQYHYDQENIKKAKEEAELNDSTPEKQFEDLKIIPVKVPVIEDNNQQLRLDCLSLISSQ